MNEDGLLSFVVSGLNRRKGQWPEVATASEVPYDTLAKIARGTTPNPGVLTCQAIERVLRVLDERERIAA